MSKKEASKVLSSVDGENWVNNRGDSDSWPDKFDRSVSKIVLGSLGEEKECRDEKVLNALLEVAGHFPALTHLYVWGIKNVEKIRGLPEALQCLDVRKCEKLTTLGHLPGKTSRLEELILAECPELSEVQEIPEGGFPELFDLEIRDCPALPGEPASSPAWAVCVMDAAPKARRVNLSGSPGIKRIKEWPAKLEDLRLNDCPKLKQLPDYWPRYLRRLELRRAKRIGQLEDFFEDLDYLDLVGTQNLEFLPELPGGLRTLFLYGSGILDPPASEHGEGSEENVAGKTHEFRREIELVGKGEVRRCKVLMLGNGAAGKTCLSVALDPEKDPAGECERLGSTHGVRFDEWKIETEISGQERSVTAHIWDFGGQEIYHNTHRLFMEVGAVFVVLWKSEQDGKQAPVDESGYQDDWRPLRYWIDFIKMACPHRPEILVVCSHRSERSEELVTKARTWIGDEEEAGYSLFFVDSKTRKGEFTPFVEGLKKAIGRTVERRGVKVPAHWEIAREMVEEWLRTLQELKEPGFKDVYRTFDGFRDQLETYLEKHLSATKPHEYAELKETLKGGAFQLDSHRIRRLLGFLTNSGLLFWNPRLSDERVIVGQQWALNGIYSALERRKGFPVYKELISRRGRFTVMDLPEESWQKRPEEERRLLVSFMKLTGICFPLVSRGESYWGEEVLVSITHLRDFEDLGFEKLFSEASGSENVTPPLEIPRNLLHRGHWNAILASLGGYYGTTAEYARDGFFLPENKNQQSALICCEIDKKGIGGAISIRVKGPESGDFIENLQGLVESNLPAEDGLHKHAPTTRPREGNDRLPEKIKVFFSYTWNPENLTDKPVDYEKPVDVVYEALKRENGLYPLRDKYVEFKGNMRFVSDFLGELKKADKILVFHSPKYWESNYCIWEMYAVLTKFRDSSSEPKGSLLLIEVVPSLFRSSRKQQLALDLWRDRMGDEEFDVRPWMKCFDPSVSGPQEMVDFAISVLHWLPRLDDPEINKIQWDAKQEADLIKQIKKWVNPQPQA